MDISAERIFHGDVHIDEKEFKGLLKDLHDLAENLCVTQVNFSSRYPHLYDLQEVLFKAEHGLD